MISGLCKLNEAARSFPPRLASSSSIDIGRQKRYSSSRRRNGRLPRLLVILATVPVNGFTIKDMNILVTSLNPNNEMSILAHRKHHYFRRTTRIQSKSFSHGPANKPIRTLRTSLSNDNDNNDISERKHPLFQLAELIPVECQEASRCFESAALAWESGEDWSAVAEALGETAQAFQQDGNNCFSSFVSGVIIEELYDISTIEGCMSLGPATSIPNWMAIRDDFADTGHDELAVIVDELIAWIAK
jgi:hypothetical protein